MEPADICDENRADGGEDRELERGGLGLFDGRSWEYHYIRFRLKIVGIFGFLNGLIHSACVMTRILIIP